LHCKIFFPVHPRTRNYLINYAFLDKKVPDNLILNDPISYNEMIVLEKSARVIITDSGGVQEETCILKRPCVTLRDNTERPETIEVGSNILSGVEPEKIIDCVNIIIDREKNWINPFGNGDSSKKIIDILEKNL